MIFMESTRNLDTIILNEISSWNQLTIFFNILDFHRYFWNKSQIVSISTEFYQKIIYNIEEHLVNKELIIEEISSIPRIWISDSLLSRFPEIITLKINCFNVIKQFQDNSNYSSFLKISIDNNDNRYISINSIHLNTFYQIGIEKELIKLRRMMRFHWINYYINNTSERIMNFFHTKIILENKDLVNLLQSYFYKTNPNSLKYDYFNPIPNEIYVELLDEIEKIKNRMYTIKRFFKNINLEYFKIYFKNLYLDEIEITEIIDFFLRIFSELIWIFLTNLRYSKNLNSNIFNKKKLKKSISPNELFLLIENYEDCETFLMEFEHEIITAYDRLLELEENVKNNKKFKHILKLINI